MCVYVLVPAIGVERTGYAHYRVRDRGYCVAMERGANGRFAYVDSRGFAGTFHLARYEKTYVIFLRPPAVYLAETSLYVHLTAVPGTAVID